MASIIVPHDDDNVYSVDSSTGNQNWSKNIGSVGRAATTVDGSVYVTGGSSIYSLDAATGNQQWSFSTSGSIYSSPTVANSTVYVGSYDDNVYAVDAATGSQEWESLVFSSINSSPTVIDEVVFIGHDDGGNLQSGAIKAFDADTGNQLWSFGTGNNDNISSPTVKNKTVFVGSNDNNVYALDATTGDKQWEFTTGDQVRSSPTIVDGTVFIGSLDNTVYALDAATGSEQWSVATGDSIWSSPTVANGTVFIGSADNNMYALDAATGSEQWSSAAGDTVFSSPTVNNNSVYFGDIVGNLYSLETSTGNENWNVSLGSSTVYSPTFVESGESTGTRVKLRTLGHLSTDIILPRFPKPTRWSLLETTESGSNTYEIKTLQEEIRTHKELELTWKTDKNTLSNILRPEFSGTGKFDVVDRTDGGFEVVDLSGSRSDVSLQCRSSVRPIEKWYISNYSEEQADQSGEVWNISITVSPTKEKSYDNSFNTISGSSLTRGTGEWKIELELGDITTKNVSAKIQRQPQNEVENITLVLLLDSDEIRIAEESLSKLGAVNYRDVPDGVDVVEDASSSNSNTITITPPTNADISVSSGDYVVESWETEWNTNFYRMTLDITQIQ